MLSGGIYASGTMSDPSTVAGGDDGMKADERGKDGTSEPMGVKEAKDAMIMRRPYTPTQREIDEHMPLHLPYRAWCPHCVAGRGIS